MYTESTYNSPRENPAKFCCLVKLFQQIQSHIKSSPVGLQGSRNTGIESRPSKIH